MCIFGKKKYVYLDHAATTPMDTGIAKKMHAIHISEYANPGGIHRMAREAQGLLDDARTRLASRLGVQSGDIVFTRGGTESIVMGLWGVIAAYRDEYPDSVPHVLLSAIEHPAVRESIWAWADQGLIIAEEIPVDTDGIVDIGMFKKMLQPETLLASVMYVNNEIGSIQPIREIAKIIRHWRKHQETIYPYFHTDAVQAVNYLDINIPRLGVDLLSLTASKMYGPKGMGALYIHPRITVAPLMHGGDQEFDIRPGTPDVAGCVGCADALDHTRILTEQESERLQEIKYRTLALLQESGIEYRLYGNPDTTIPGTCMLGIPGVLGERLVIELDARGFAVSSRAACSTNAEGASHVLTAMGYTDGWGSIRISMGRTTTYNDMKQFVHALTDVVKKIAVEKEIIHNLSVS